jgi:hypothetical protein
MNPDEYQNYVSEVDHYTEHFPTKVGKYNISQAQIGTALEILEVVVPSLFDPIKIPGSQGKVMINIELAKDNNGDVIPGVIAYNIRAERSPKEERKGQEKSKLIFDIVKTVVVAEWARATLAAETARAIAVAEAAVAEAAVAEAAVAEAAVAEAAVARAARGAGFLSTVGKIVERVASRVSNFIIAPGFLFEQQKEPPI